jgi:nucleotide-binding universal stress UspA family protein
MEDEADARRELEAFGAKLPGARIAYETPTAAGDEKIEHVLVAAATRLEADVIVMATHGTSALRNILAGSVARGVLKGSPIPMILKRPEKA